jgi:hypothetical protein
MLRRPLMRRSPHSLILKQAYIHFIASVNRWIGDCQLFGELACRELGSGFDHSARADRVDYFRVAGHSGLKPY